MHKFEEILEKGTDKCGWSDETKYILLLEFMEKYCIDKLDKFEEVMESIIVDESSGRF